MNEDSPIFKIIWFSAGAFAASVTIFLVLAMGFGACSPG